MSKKIETGSAFNFESAADESTSMMSNRDIIEHKSRRIRIGRDGTMQIGNVDVTTIGFDIEVAEITEEEYAELGETILSMDGAVQWLLGDWMAYGENNKFGETYGRLAVKYGKQVETLYHYTRVSRAVNFCIRTQRLHYGHHRLVAGIKGQSKQHEWLLKAVRNGWTVEDMRQEMKHKKAVVELTPESKFKRNVKSMVKRYTKQSLLDKSQMAAALRSLAEELERHD